MSMEQNLQNKFKGVIATLGNRFSSHDFIKAFLAKHEEDYRKWFSDLSLQETHAKIGKLLVDNQKALGIEKDERIESETFHGTIVKIQGWKKVFLTLVLALMSSVHGISQDFVNAFGDWKWIYTEVGAKHSTEYPVRMTYYTYDSHPQYKIVDNAIYDEKGTLKCILPISISRYWGDTEFSSKVETILGENSERDFQEKVKSTANEIVKSFPLPANFAYYFGSNELFQRSCENITNDLKLGKPGMYKLFNFVKIKQTESGEKIIQKLKKKDLTFLDNYADSINSHNKHWKLMVVKGRAGFDPSRGVFDEGIVAKIYVNIYPGVVSRQPITDEQRLQAETEVWKSFEEKATIDEKAQKDAKNALELSLCASDYMNNKYEVNNESEKVRMKIEQELGLRTNDEEVEAMANELLQSFCKNAGIKYSPGMTKEEIKTAYVKKYGKLDYKLFNELAATMRDFYKKALFGSLMVSADENNKTAYRYINQLKNDNSKWTENLITISRVNDTSFRLEYGSEENGKKSVIVNYFSEKPFTNTYKVTVE